MFIVHACLIDLLRREERVNTTHSSRQHYVLALWGKISGRVQKRQERNALHTREGYSNPRILRRIYQKQTFVDIMGCASFFAHDDGSVAVHLPNLPPMVYVPLQRKLRRLVDLLPIYHMDPKYQGRETASTGVVHDVAHVHGGRKS